MRMKSALLLIGGFTVFLGLANFVTSAFQERVSTCETRINNTQLQVINQLQQQSSNELKIVQYVLARQIETATGVAGPVSPEVAQVFQAARNLNEQAMRATERMRVFLEEGCDSERRQWFVLSIIAVLASSLIACLAFWVGLRVVDPSKIDPSSPPQDPGEAARPVDSA